MKKSIICVAMLAIACTGCAVPVAVHKQQADELKALGAYHKAEKEAVKADKARAVAAGALVATTAIKLKADKDLEQAKASLDEALKQ
ncbi:MAG: hypothetical protein ACRDDI_13570 [Aeromonas veronii]